MIYEYVRKAWEEGKVSVGLPVVDHGHDVSLEGRGYWLNLACSLLGESSKDKIAELAKQIANAQKLIAPAKPHRIINIDDAEGLGRTVFEAQWETSEYQNDLAIMQENPRIQLGGSTRYEGNPNRYAIRFKIK